MKKALVGPFITAMLTAILLCRIGVPSIEICKIDFVLNAIITCVVTLAGFILTSVSIIVGMSSSPVMRKISKEGGLKELIARYTTTLILSLLLIMLFITFGAAIQKDNILSDKMLIAGATILASYLFSLITTCYYLLSIISKIPTESPVETIDEPTVPEGEFR